MDGGRRDLTVNLAFSLVLHFLVFAGVFLTPSLYSHRFHVPVAYKVTLVDLPGTQRGPSSPAGKPDVKVEAPKAEIPKAPTPAAPPSKAKPSEVKPQAPTPSPDALSLPKKQKVPPKSARAPEPSGVPSVPSSSAKVHQAPIQAGLPGQGGTGLVGIASETGTAGESGDPNLSYYLALIQAKVSSRWAEPSAGLALGQAQRVTVGFIVLRSGLVRDIQVLTPSGSFSLDQSALRAVTEAVPFPPFPPLFAEEKLLVRFHFEMRGQ